MSDMFCWNLKEIMRTHRVKSEVTNHDTICNNVVNESSSAGPWVDQVVHLTVELMGWARTEQGINRPELQQVDQL